MQDFAKIKPIADRELAPHGDEWKLDAASALFGALLGAIIVFAGVKAAEYRETQPSNEKIAENVVVEESDPGFEFYEVLKRDGLYPARSNITYQD